MLRPDARSIGSASLAPVTNLTFTHPHQIGKKARRYPRRALTAWFSAIPWKSPVYVLSLSVHSSRNVFVLRSSGASAFTIFSPSDSVEDIAFLFGRIRERERGWLRGAVGPSLVRVVRYGPAYDCPFFFCSYDSEESYQPGLALQAEAVWTLADAFGLGLTGFANLNGEFPYAGLALGVHLGRVRRR